MAVLPVCLYINGNVCKISTPLRALRAVVVPIGILASIAAVPANTQNLNFSLPPAQRDSLPGQTVTFTGILSNPNNFTVYIDNVGATFTDQNSANNLTVLPSGNANKNT